MSTGVIKMNEWMDRSYGKGIVLPCSSLISSLDIYTILTKTEKEQH